MALEQDGALSCGEAPYRNLLGVAATAEDLETTRCSGCVRLEAPTGAGKTVMAAPLSSGL